LKGRGAVRQGSRPRSQGRRLRFETVEERRLLSISLGALANKAVTEGSPYSDAIAIVDPGASGYAATVYYGDGEVDGSPTLLNVNGDELLVLDHIYGQTGSYNVTADVQDNFGQRASSNTAAITVSEGAASLSGLPTSASQGWPMSFTESFSDPGWGVQYAYAVSWGDGSSNDAGSATIDTSGQAHVSAQGHFDLWHTFADVGTYTATVSLYEVDNGVESTTAIGTDSESITVNARTAATATLAASAFTSTYGQDVAITATVAGSGLGDITPTGTVTFSDGSTVLGTANLDGNGNASIDVPDLSIGYHVVTASYGGDVNFAASPATEIPDTITTVAQVGWCATIAVDAAGDIFSSNPIQQDIAEVNHDTGVATTVAGNGTAGYSGDGGPATAAELNCPSAVAFDAAGDLFFADSGNNRVREVNVATGVITTVAGDGTEGFAGDYGQATTAELFCPEGIAIDSAGNLFVADTGNNRIRDVSLSTGVITTVAGNGAQWCSGDGGPATAAGLDRPCSLAVDGAGHLFIVEPNDNLVREFSTSTGMINAFAGDGTVGPSGNGGPATAARLAYPMSVAADSAGNVFITDQGSNSVREVIASTDVITAFAGNGTYGYTGENGPATATGLGGELENVVVDASGNVLISDSGYVREVTTAPGYGAVLNVLPAPLIITNGGDVTATPMGNNGYAIWTWLSISDPNNPPDLQLFWATISYGDGSGPQALFDGAWLGTNYIGYNYCPTYDYESYTVTFSVEDVLGAIGSTSFTVCTQPS
jgi:hypothetical protein